MSNPTGDLDTKACLCENSSNGINFDIEADDITVEDSVTVVWEIL